MKKLAVSLALIAVVSVGCMTSKKVTTSANPDGSFTSTTNVVVNEANLALDCTAISGVTAVAVNTALIQSKHDPVVLQALKNSKTALDAILFGTSQQTTQQVLDLLKINGNPALEQQVSQLVDTVSKLELALLQKYGTTVKGEIANSILQAIDTGLTIGLAGS